jgi:hypothetical protein
MTPAENQVPPCRNGTQSAFGRKAHICAEVLNEARRLYAAGRLDGSLSQLVARSCELLDDLDEILVTLRPSQDNHEFASAAGLHRELEFLQKALSARREKHP